MIQTEHVEFVKAVFQRQIDVFCNPFNALSRLEFDELNLLQNPREKFPLISEFLPLLLAFIFDTFPGKYTSTFSYFPRPHKYLFLIEGEKKRKT